MNKKKGGVTAKTESKGDKRGREKEIEKKKGGEKG
jgi:hypothetical protein